MIVPSQKRARRHSRHAQRGAAMIEAIVIMCTMLTFLGMNLFAVKAYGGKLDQSTAARRDAMYYATHNCKENNGSDPDTYTDPLLKSAGGAQGNGSFGTIKYLVTKIAGSAKAGGGGMEEPGASSVTKGETTVVGEAVVWQSKRFMTSKLRTSSAALCNEKPYYGGILSTLGSMAWDFIKSIKDLF